MALSPLDQIREAAEADLETFIKLVSPKRLLGSIHQELCRWWGREDAKASQLVLLPRGHQKSAMIAYRAAWHITKHPDTTILYVSATADLAEKQLYAIKNIIDSPIYKRYWPTMLDPDEGKREKWSVAEICVDHPLRKTEGVRDSTVKAAGLTTNVTGFHADVLIYDDIVVPGNAYTEDGREKVAAAYSQLASVANPGALEWITGTRYHPRDIYDTLLSMKETVYDKHGEVIREDEVYEVFQRVVEEDGEFLWPKQSRNDGKYFGFDNNILARIKAKYVDKTQFYAQYYNQPNSAENAPIDSSKFQYYDKSHLKTVEGDWYFKDNKLNTFAAIDFAFSLGKKSDYTALVTIGVDYEYNYYVLDIDRFKTNRITEYFEHIKKAQYKWGFRKIRCEVTVAQQMIVQELKENYIKPQGLTLSIDEFRPNRSMGDKAERVMAILQPKFDNLQMWFYKGGNCQILEEELVLAHPPHDDVSDALANAVAISTAPKKMFSTRSSGNIIYNSRFGGISF
jgi:phage terminase large subunit-like protein